MRIILLKDVVKFGKKGDIKNVSDGYGNNFLIAKGLAKKATESTIAFSEREKINLKLKLEKENEKAKKMAAQIESLDIKIPLKIGERGVSFGSISASKISQILRERGLNIDKNQIELSGAIKTLGDHNVAIKLAKEVKAHLKITAVAEN